MVSLAEANVKLRGPRQLPVRTTADDDSPSVKPLPQRRYKTTASIFTRQEMLEYLLGCLVGGRGVAGSLTGGSARTERPS